MAAYSFLPLPETDEQVHRNKCYLIEHEHGEEVDADEETVYTSGEQREPHEELFGQRLELPRCERAGEDDDAGEKQHHNADAVNADGIRYVEWGKPYMAVLVEHLSSVACSTLTDEVERQPDAQSQEAGGTGYHHSTNLIDVAGTPKAQQHQYGNNNK